MMGTLVIKMLISCSYNTVNGAVWEINYELHFFPTYIASRPTSHNKLRGTIKSFATINNSLLIVVVYCRF